MRISIKFIITLFLTVVCLSNFNVFAQNSAANEFDTLRQELFLIKDKNSSNYIKIKNKLNKYILNNKIDYSNNARFLDVERLISEKKFDCAKYELNDLIDQGIELSKSYELLGDIEYNNSNSKKASYYYKLSLQYDSKNQQTLLKISKTYLREKKNIIGLEYLNKYVSICDDFDSLKYVEGIIKDKITPQNRYEANNMYEILGMIYEKKGEKQEAYNAYNRAIQLNPKDIFLKYYLAGILYEDKENNSVVTLCDSILEENATDLQIKLLKAKSLLKSGNLLSAHQEFSEILKINPESRVAKYGIFKIYENKMGIDEILKRIYVNVPNFQPTKEECLNFAYLLDDFGDDVAAAKCRRFVEECILKEKQVAQNNVVNNKQVPTVQTVKKKQTKKAVPVKQKARQVAPVKKKTPTKKVINSKQISQELPKKEVGQAKNVNKKQELVHNQTILSAHELNQKLIQEKTPKQKTIQPTAQVDNSAKRIASEIEKAKQKDLKKFNEQNVILNKYLKTEPKTAQIYVAIANTYKAMGVPTASLKYYKSAIKVDPTNSDLYYHLGLTYMELNSFETAKSNLERSVGLNTENSKAVTLLGFVNQKIVTQIVNNAYEKYEKKEYIDAFDILNDGIKQFPNSAPIYYYRALVCDAINRNAAQIMDLQKAIELDPGYYMAYYQLGRAFEKINDERSALVAYERFLSIEPEEEALVGEIQQKVISLGKKYY